MPHALIIDDDANNLGVLQELLTMEGMHYTAVLDATSVEEMLPTLDPVDVVLLDLEMPDLDGYQLFEILSNMPQMSGVPIVACTVHTNESETAQSLGFHSFIAKPLDVDTFGQNLALILGGERVWQPY